MTVLQKVYGPLHNIYPVYLLGYFAAMVTAIVYATVRETIASSAYAVFLAIAVFVNIVVWFLEQLVRIDFEILSVSYIISESFLLGLHLLRAEQEKAPRPAPAQPALEAAPAPPAPDPALLAQLELFDQGLTKLTPKEQALYRCYTDGMSTPEILDALSIKENTLKYHNKNLYGKLGVSSRKQLLELYRLTKR